MGATRLASGKWEEKMRRKEKKDTSHAPHQQRQSKKSFGANNFTGWHICLSALTQRGHLDIGTKKMGYHCIPTLLTLNLILWKTRCKDTAFSEKCKPSHHKNAYMQESLTTSHNLLHTSVHSVQIHCVFSPHYTPCAITCTQPWKTIKAATQHHQNSNKTVTALPPQTYNPTTPTPPPQHEPSFLNKQ